MSRVFTSSNTGAAIYVFSNDHCPPHVHARHSGDGWIARVRFSFAGNAVELQSIAPLRNIPSQRVVNRLLDDVETELPACRRSWWTIRQTTCLDHQWAIASTPGAIELVLESSTGAQQIAEATYVPESERLCVKFRDGTTMEARI
jgi:hypothetical protein